MSIASVIRKGAGAVVDVERRHHVFSTGITLVVVMAALCAGALLLLKVLIDALFAGWAWG